MENSVALPTYEAKVAWSDQIPGVFTVGYSQVGGTDTLGAEYPEHTFTSTYDDLSTRVLSLNYQRGRSDDLTEVVATQGSLEILDAEETYNPHNRDSPIAAQLLPLRPYRIRAVGPRLVRLTTNGWQMDDSIRARSLTGDDFERALLRKKPLAYWRLNEVAGAAQYFDAAGDPDAYAYAGGSALAQADSLLAGDPGYAQDFNGASYLTVNHTDTINPRATLTAIALFTPDAAGCLMEKPNQWMLALDSGLHLAFTYTGTDDHVVSVRSLPALIAGTPYLAVACWNGKTVRMWLNRDEVEVVNS